MSNCISENIAFIRCLYHHDIIGSKCLLAYCAECGKDIERECEREGANER